MINLTGTFAAFRLLTNPSLCLPHGTVSNFNDIPVPISKAFGATAREKAPDIRAVILDKDNCFAVPKTDTIYPEYESKFTALRRAYPTTLLILSNTAGLASSDPQGTSATALSRTTGVPVLRHAVPKPGCSDAIMGYFAARPELGVTHPSQVAVVGDRLLTDIIMANEGGMHGLWVRDGVVPPRGVEGVLVGFEKRLERFLRQRGFEAPDPLTAAPNPFE